MDRREFLISGVTAGLFVSIKEPESAELKQQEKSNKQFYRVYSSGGPIFESKTFDDIWLCEQLSKAQEIELRYFEFSDIKKQGVELILQFKEESKVQFFGGKIADIYFTTDKFCYEIRDGVFLSHSRERIFIDGKVTKSVITDRSNWFYV